MTRHADDNETWLIETGHDVIDKVASGGVSSLSAYEQLIYCLWVADYGMRNAGDLDTATDVDATFHEQGRKLAAELGLPKTLAAFDLSKPELERRFFELFDGVCAELRAI